MGIWILIFTKILGQSEFHCNVDGKIYKIGQEFYPQENPDLVCHCLEGYNGKSYQRKVSQFIPDSSNDFELKEKTLHLTA